MSFLKISQNSLENTCAEVSVEVSEVSNLT